MSVVKCYNGIGINEKEYGTIDSNCVYDTINAVKNSALAAEQIKDKDERYVAKYHNRYIKIAAECIYFKDGENLTKKLAEMAELKKKSYSDIRAKLKLTF